MSAEPLVRRTTSARHRPVATSTRERGSVPTTKPPAPVVSVIVPTLDEAANIDAVLDRLGATLTGGLPGLAYEIIVVDDDSADETWRLAGARSEHDPRIRVIRRVGRRGLSSAVLAGMAIARGEVLVVIDGDLQHDEARIPDLVLAITGGADVALGSREVDGGGYGPFGRRRLAISRIGQVLSRRVIGIDVTDPMSGFFAVSKARHDELSGSLNPRGFKILLEFLARGSEPVLAEIGYEFRQRTGGTTKLDTSVILGFVVSLIELSVARRLGRRRRRRHRSREQGTTAAARGPGPPAARSRRPPAGRP